MQQTPPGSFDVLTFGCRLNAYESEVIRQNALAAGVENTIVINSCAVTKEAERQVRQSIRKARRENPAARIVVTGCAAQIHPDAYAAMNEVDAILGNLEKLEADALSPAKQSPMRVGNIAAAKTAEAPIVNGFEARTRAFVQVQQGCDHSCTFCIIPQGRGPSRSVGLEKLAEQLQVLLANGVREVVLTGVDITSYGSDLPGTPTLGQMMRRLLALVPDLPRLRLSSVDPKEIDADVLRLLAEEPRFMPHLHLSAQAGDDMILKRMKRRHLRADVIALCDEMRKLRPEVVFGADLIAGFPTETEEMFENSLNLVREAGLTYLHVFPYSERDGTPAARMPQVNKALRKERAARLRSLGKQQVEAHLQSLFGKKLEVLIEKIEGDVAQGHSHTFAPVRLDLAKSANQRARLLKVGDICTVTIVHKAPHEEPTNVLATNVLATNVLEGEIG